jgi:hypothetical protein
MIIKDKMREEGEGGEGKAGIEQTQITRSCLKWLR